ncbi:hypothetical protein V1502_17695 [Bacillus sp. SCS-153A]|uniref:hypothetical protein n=1 Tax=Rossellomorea sedimentorum TaxID=3115294 RepID=UPI003905C80F
MEDILARKILKNQFVRLADRTSQMVDKEAKLVDRAFKLVDRKGKVIDRTGKPDDRAKLLFLNSPFSAQRLEPPA